MKSSFLTLFSIFAFSLSVMATSHQIEVESYSYPSPADAHLRNIQSDLAAQAVLKCGGRQQVESIDKIQIQIVAGLNEAAPVGKLSDGEYLSIELWYPRLKATALVDCK